MTKEGNNCPDCIKAKAAYDRLDARMAQRGNFGIVPLPIRCEKHRLTTATDKPKNGNPHIIVGPNRRCLCGVYGIASTLGERAISCAELLSKLESLVQTRNTDAFELWEAISPLVEDCSQPTPPTPASAGTETARTEQVARNIGKLLAEYKHGPLGLADTANLIDDALNGSRAIERELTSLRRQAEADRATIATLKAEVERLRGQERSWLACYEALSKTPQWEQTRDRVYAFGMKHAVDTIALLIAQLATADKDRERLDWADKNTPYILQSIDRNGRPYYSIMNPFNDGWRTLRAAIDAAMQPSPSLDHGATGGKAP